MTWFLDACVVIRAQDAGLLVRFIKAANALGASLAEEVYLEVCGRPGSAPRLAQTQAKAVLDEHQLPVVGIDLTSSEAEIYAHLRGGRTSTGNAGECQSIAIASGATDSMFVTAETKAGWLGVVELDGRTRALPSLLRAMVEAGHLDRADADTIMDSAESRSNVRRPSWWGSFQ